MSCCKVNINEEKEVKTSIVTKVFQVLMMVFIVLVIFPIIYFYVIYMVIKNIVTGKGNKISDIVSNLKDGLGLLMNDKEVGNPEYYSLDDLSEDDVELESLHKEENE